VRELETIRSFLTGQALFSALDLLFASCSSAFSSPIRGR
jgi:ABC-type bacteriocin/lantibiotic exporter with double-glycine peptidase domain